MGWRNRLDGHDVAWWLITLLVALACTFGLALAYVTGFFRIHHHIP